MTLPTSSTKTTTWPISVGAEAIATAQFARCGFDVLAQSLRDKPWYDFAVTRAGNLLKISVKASEDGRWNLTQSFARRGAENGSKGFDCRSAVDFWVDSQGTKTICCLVQFEGVTINQLPRIYLAFPNEIAAEMRAAAERTNHCALLEKYEWTSIDGKRERSALPANWRFSQERIQELIDRQAAPLFTGTFSKSSFNSASVPLQPRSQGTREIALSA
jgi:hypothetical protein